MTATIAINSFIQMMMDHPSLDCVNRVLLLEKKGFSPASKTIDGGIHLDP